MPIYNILCKCDWCEIEDDCRYIFQDDVPVLAICEDCDNTPSPINMNNINKENKTMNKHISTMTLDELHAHAAMLFECGAEMTTCKSAYESEEEFQMELAPITEELNATDDLINNWVMDHEVQEVPVDNSDVPNEDFININKKENNMKKCCVITSKGACGTKYGINIVQVMVKGGQIIDPKSYREGNMTGWYFQDVPTCASHRGSLSRGKTLDAYIPLNPLQVNALEETKIMLSFMGEEPKVEKVKTIRCGKGHDHLTKEEVKACYGNKSFSANFTPKKTLCGNCRKNNVADPYHNSPAEVKECYTKK